MNHGRTILCFIVWGIASGSASSAISVFRPSFGVPAFIEPGGAFTAEVRAASGLASNGWFAYLANDLRRWTCHVAQVAYGTRVYNNSLTGYQLRVESPSDLPPELFRLVLGHPSAGTTTNRHAVQAVSCIETSFYILHYADPQASGSNALYASGMNSPYGSIEELYWHAPVINLIHPRFLLNTGDELDDGDVDTEQRYRQYLNAMDTVNTAILITRGNNDRGNFDHWKTNIGQACYAIFLGSFAVWMNDTRGNEMYAWFTNAYALSFGDTNITYRLLGQHFYDNADGKNPYFFAPPAGQYPNLELVGHNHTFATLQTSPFPILSSGPAHNYGAFTFFEFLKLGTSWHCPQATNHPAAGAAQAVGAWGAPRVSLSYAASNNGSVTSNLAFITNTLPLNFWDGRVRFLMAPSTAGYAVSGGVKLAEYVFNETNRAVLVEVNILPNTQQVVTIWAVPDFDGDGIGDEEDTDDDNDGMPDAWETEHGFNARDPADASEDEDSDGVSNVAEFIAGTDPTNATSVFIISVLSNGPPFTISVVSASGRWYNVYARDSWGVADWDLLTNLGPATGGDLVIQDNTSASQRFYRCSARMWP